jgi:hypothetical protein
MQARRVSITEEAEFIGSHGVEAFVTHACERAGVGA